jgi:hypothetical protein
VRRRFLTAAVLLVLAAGGCGGESTSAPARPRTVALDWHEAPGRAGARLIVDVRRLVVRADGWSVDARVKNGTTVPYTIGRPHHPGQSEFGVLLLSSPSVQADDIAAAGPGVLASRYSPPLPRVLHPGEAWSGTFSGRGRLTGARYLRVQLGRFTTVGPRRPGLPWRFGYVTDHVLKLSG